MSLRWGYVTQKAPSQRLWRGFLWDTLARESMDRDAVHASLMATALKGGVQVLVHYLAGHVGVDETAGHDQDVSIIVLTDKVSYLGDPAQSGADALMLVQGHGDTLSAAAHGYTLLYLTLLYAAGQCVAVVGVVTAIGGEGAVVLELQPLLLQVFYHKLL